MMENLLRRRAGTSARCRLLADVEARFRTPEDGGRATDPRWTERRLVPLAPDPLKRLASRTTRRPVRAVRRNRHSQDRDAGSNPAGATILGRKTDVKDCA